MKFPTPDLLFTALWNVCKRFPGTMFCSLIGALTCFTLIDLSYDSNSEGIYARIWMACQLGLPLLTALVAFGESKGWSAARSLGLQGIGLLGVLLCWFWIDPSSADYQRITIPKFTVLLLVGHLAVSVLPFLNARPVSDFWEYNRQIFANIIVGFAFTLILYAGLALAILAIDQLFGFDISERVYAKLFILLAGVFNTVYFLAHFPTQYSFETEETGAYNWVFRTLCKYILIPITLLYFVILYLYGGKIVLTWSLPKGWVSSLVAGFSVAGIFTYLLNFYLPESDNSGLVKGFKRWFWWGLLPLTALLFVAIGKRIGDYGVTETRFLMAEMGIWLAGICLYFLFSKHDNIKVIPASLAVFALLWAFGPLSAFSVSERSQKEILTELLRDAGRFKDGKMMPGTLPVSEEKGNQIRSTLDYLEDRNAHLDLLPQPVDNAWFEYGGLMKWLGLETFELDGNTNLQIGSNDDDNQLIVRGFDIATRLQMGSSEMPIPKMDGTYFSLSASGTMLERRQKTGEKTVLVETFSLASALQKWAAKRTQNGYVGLSLAERTATLSSKNGNIQLVVESGDIAFDNSVPHFNYVTAWVLFKEK